MLTSLPFEPLCGQALGRGIAFARAIDREVRTSVLANPSDAAADSQRDMLAGDGAWLPEDLRKLRQELFAAASPSASGAASLCQKDD